MPAVEGFNPILSAGLYITNGETCDWAHGKADTLCYTPELSTPPAGSGAETGFHFPDDEDLIQGEFLKNLPFALDIAKSAADLTSPSSHLGNTIDPMYVDQFEISYGSPQAVEVNAQRDLGDVTMHYQINDGPEVSVPTVAWEGGERFGEKGDVHYHRLRSWVEGAEVGDEVRVWFSSETAESISFTYLQEYLSEADVLVVAAEDYTGINPVYEDQTGPNYLDVYVEALEELDLLVEVYDVDFYNRIAPHYLSVLSHFKEVVWYTGDDVAPQREDMEPGNVSVQAFEMMIAMRAFLNEGGKVIHAGRYVGFPYFARWEYEPEFDDVCDPQSGDDGCDSLVNDFYQYYFGAWSRSSVDPVMGGSVDGQLSPFDGMSTKFKDPEPDSPHTGAVGFETTSEVMPIDAYPQFESVSLADYEGGGRPTSERR